MKSKLVILGLILTLVALPLAACAQPAPAPAPAPAAPQQPAPAPAPTPAPAPKPAKVTRLLLVSTSITSGYFPASVGMAEAINKHVPDVEITVVESWAGFGNVAKLVAGEADLTDQGATVTVLTESYYGTGGGVEYYAPELRVLFPEAGFVYLDGVREDSGITSYADLDGKIFFWGRPGSSSEYYAQIQFEVTGITVEKLKGSFADAVAAVKDNRAVGLKKASSVTALDSIFLDIHTLTPIRLLSLTEEEGKDVRANLIGSIDYRIPAGTYEALPGHPEIIAMGGVQSVSALSTRISQELGYKLVKGWAENWDEVITVHPAMVREPIKDFASFFILDGKALIPMHAGTVQYFKEIGVDVPAALIPPEYKG